MSSVVTTNVPTVIDRTIEEKDTELNDNNKRPADDTEDVRDKKAIKLDYPPLKETTDEATKEPEPDSNETSPVVEEAQKEERPVERNERPIEKEGSSDKVIEEKANSERPVEHVLTENKPELHKTAIITAMNPPLLNLAQGAHPPPPGLHLLTDPQQQQLLQSYVQAQGQDLANLTASSLAQAMVSPIPVPSLATNLLQQLQQGGTIITALPGPPLHQTSSALPNPTHDDSQGNGKRASARSLSNDERRQRRLLRNRVAAKECRKKKKQHIQDMEERIVSLEEENGKLQKEVEELKAKLSLGSLQGSESYRLMKEVEELNAKLSIGGPLPTGGAFTAVAMAVQQQQQLQLQQHQIQHIQDQQEKQNTPSPSSPVISSPDRTNLITTISTSTTPIPTPSTPNIISPSIKPVTEDGKSTELVEPKPSVIDSSLEPASIN